jgi:PIN domain nuclease of toxin-antitoxin system
VERRGKQSGAAQTEVQAVKFLLDTHVLVKWVNGGISSTAQRRALRSVSPSAPLGVADITLWEIASLEERGRLKLALPLREWLLAAVAPPLVRCLDLSPAVAAEMASLAVTRDWDPADRIIVATARVHGLKLVTSDERIAESGLVPVVG